MSTPIYGGDEVNAVVLDIGTYQVKAGYAGEDAPKFLFPSAFGATPAAGEAMDVDGGGARRRTLHVGTHGLSIFRPGMEAGSPYGPDGVLGDWEAVEATLEHALRTQMRLDTELHPVLLAEPSHNARAARERAVELLFEKFNAPAVFLAKNAVLSSFASGRQTSLVVDAGHEGTVVAAVHDGYVLSKSVVRSPLGGRLLTRCLLASAEAGGASVRPRYAFRRAERPGAPGTFDVEYLDPADTPSLRAAAQEAIMADAKAALCRVADAAFDPDDAAAASLPTVPYELPDGQEIHVGADRFAVPELLFNPGLLPRYGAAGAAAGPPAALAGLPGCVAECVSRCDVDARRELFGGVLLTGGTAGFATLRDRLDRELAAAAPAAGVKVRVLSPANAVERRFSVWVGGSILASLGSFQQMWVSKAEFRELGAGVVHKKAP